LKKIWTAQDLKLLRSQASTLTLSVGHISEEDVGQLDIGVDPKISEGETTVEGLAETSEINTQVLAIEFASEE
jgi:hypothetical protein